MGGKLLKRADSNRERLADTIVASADRGAQMIKKLLAFAGGEAGVQERIDVHEILREAEDILRHTLPMTIELQVDCSDDLYAVSGDATELSQVILNLAINARDAMPDGGRLELRAANFQVEPSQNERGDDLQAGPHVLITVHDTGTGIPRSIIDRIFDPFFTTKEQGNGTGLGLATSLGIVRTHGGDITVSSEPGQGTTFTILLPATEQELGPRDSTEIGSSSAGNGEMILLVDDEPLIVETTRATLEAAGYQVNTAAGGAEAVAVYREKADTIDLVILDMMMPGIDGFATKDRLRDINPSVRVIASSGFRRPSDEGGRMNDVQGFLPKPYSDEQLLRLIRNVLDEKLHPESD